MHSMPRNLLALSASALSLSACLEDLPEITRVSDLRILALQSEPPELAPGETTQLTALVVDPFNRPISYQWYACLIPEAGSGLFGGSAETSNSGGSNAGLDRDEFGDSCVGRAEAGERWAFKLGESADATFTVPADLFDTQDALRVAYELPDGIEIPATIAQGFLGISGVNYRISLRVEVDGRVEEAQKLVNVSLPSARVDTAPNTNPAPPVLDVRDPEDIDNVPESGNPHTSGSCFSDPQIALAAQREYLMSPLNLPAQYESYAVILSAASADSPFELRQREEQLFFSWFMTDGETSKTISRTSTDPSNIWTTPAQGTSVDLWVVARDGRGGISWCQESISLPPRQ